MADKQFITFTFVDLDGWKNGGVWFGLGWFLRGDYLAGKYGIFVRRSIVYILTIVSLKGFFRQNDVYAEHYRGGFDRIDANLQKEVYLTRSQS
jgi:hypothetical protein